MRLKNPSSLIGQFVNDPAAWLHYPHARPPGLSTLSRDSAGESLIPFDRTLPLKSFEPVKCLRIQDPGEHMLLPLSMAEVVAQIGILHEDGTGEIGASLA